MRLVFISNTTNIKYEFDMISQDRYNKVIDKIIEFDKVGRSSYDIFDNKGSVKILYGSYCLLNSESLSRQNINGEEEEICVCRNVESELW